MKTTVVHHSADFDGLFCREIAKKFLPDAELIGWDFGNPPLAVPEGLIYVMDLPIDKPFNAAFVNGWWSVGGEQTQPLDRIDWSNFVWIDHHKSAIDSHPADIPGYRIDGVAACRLAWQWFYLHVERGTKESCLPEKWEFVERELIEPLAVRLAGEYDIWDKRDERADILQFGLRSRELTESDWRNLLSTERPTIDEIESLIAAGHQTMLEPDGTCAPAVLWGLLDAGRTLQRYQQRNDAGMMHRSFLVEFEGLKFLTLTTARCNSLTFAVKDKPETGHDALMGFYFDGKGWTVSLYHAEHRKDIDLSLIAVKYGGGGHRGACGFRVEKLPFLP